ncbi:PadR family transcriptional regulator [Herbiconiux sp. L3-i23]|uniref:PadR family transcriptional regulator n=1 Tax=Herbiconiux sp. L3-i23 TaxID=2905871 RepID=UPI00204A72D5|nr:PadR family transcriptional regulator [Herbiconiux sp. L3-i23]BDI24085.1 PadR family transcriptional regulator [Herbiconiux sp. L3-i23]
MSLPTLAVAALAFLSERPMHPYEMFQLMLKRREDRVVRVSAGTLYRTIERLNTDGLADEVGVDREGNRPERTTYRITERGREELDAAIASMLATPAVEFPEFALALSEANLLPATDVVLLLRSRIRRIDEELATIDHGIAAVRQKSLDEKIWIDLTYRRSMLRAQVDWIDATLARIESGDIAW